MSLPTNFNIVNRGELLAVINFPRQKTVEESFEFILSRGFDCGKEPMVFGDYVSEPQWCMYLNRQY